MHNLAGAGAGAMGGYSGGTIADRSGYTLMMAMLGVMFLLAAGATTFMPVEKG